MTNPCPTTNPSPTASRLLPNVRFRVSLVTPLTPERTFPLLASPFNLCSSNLELGTWNLEP